jgi:O-antigen ligase
MAIARSKRVSPSAILVAALLVAGTVGILVGEKRTLALALLAVAVFVPVVLLDLQLGIALWIPSLFFLAVPHMSVGIHAASGLLVIAWFGTLGARRHLVATIIARHARLIATVVAFVAWLALSLAWADKPGLAGVPLLAWAISATLFLVVLTSVTEPRHVKLILAAFVVGTTLSVVLGLVHNGLQAGSISTTTLTEYEGRLTGGMGDPNYLAASVVPAIALAFGLTAATRRPLASWELLVAMLILITGLAATQSRGGTLAFVAALVAGSVLVRRGRAYVVALASLVCIAGAVFFLASPTAWHRVTSNSNAGNGRVTQWALAWRMAQDHPLVGVGLQNFEVHEASYVARPGALDHVGLVVENPHVVHDIYLQLLAETGVVGLSLFLAVVVSCMRAMWLASRRLDAIGMVGVSRLALAVLVATVASLVGSIFLSNGSDAQLWILLGLGPALLGIARRAAGRSPRVVRETALSPVQRVHSNIPEQSDVAGPGDEIDQPAI